MNFRKWIQMTLHVLAVLMCLLAIWLNVLLLVEEFDWKRISSIAFYMMYMILFMIRRPSIEALNRPEHYMVALMATFVPLFIVPYPQSPPVLTALSIPVWIIGVLVTLGALGCLGRGFGIFAARRDIKTHGLYNFIRHPLYAGEELWILAIVLQNFCLPNLVVFLVGFACQIQRMRDEEELLSRDPIYAHYMNRVRYRLIPGLF